MSNESLEKLLLAIKDELHELHRPRLLFDIAPSKKGWFNFYDVTLKNVGGSPAYNISCTFKPDLPYANTTLSALPIFRNLHHLAQGDEISFFFDSAIKFLNDPKFVTKTTASVSYIDSQQQKFVEEVSVDLERYRDILYIEEKHMRDVVNGIEKIERILDRIQRDGLLTKTTADVKREHEQLMKRYKTNRPSKK